MQYARRSAPPLEAIEEPDIRRELILVDEDAPEPAGRTVSRAPAQTQSASDILGSTPGSRSWIAAR